MVVIIMGNMIVFKALSSETRIEIIKLLLSEEHHITGLARKIGISVPVMSRHVDILTDAGLVKKRIIGNVHLLSVNLNVFEHALDDFCDHTELHIVQNQSLFEALKQLPEIKFTKYKDKQFISSINGENGYYVYEVDGKPPTVSIDEFVPEGNVSLTLKKVVPIEKKQIKIKIKNDTDTEE